MPRPETLILVKHARPQITSTQPAAQWSLSDAGRQQCAPLADALAPWEPEVIVASEEPKATETGRLMAQRLGIPWHTATGLHEHDRSTAPYIRDEETFHARIKLLFAQPENLNFGTETARQALARFSEALDAALGGEIARSVAVVAHGTVISLYVAARFGLDGFALWYRLGLPAFVVTDAPSLVRPLVIEQLGQEPTIL